MEVRVTHLGSVRFAVEARHHTVISDQPEENGGQDTGMTPPEFLLASLGSCAAFYAAQYLKTRGLSQAGLEVGVSAEKLKQPARLGNFVVDVRCDAVLSEEQKQAMHRSVHQCVVHNTMMSVPAIDIRLHAGDAETAPLPAA